MGNKLNTEIFKQNSIAKHGNRYDYSKSIYKNKRTQVCIVCPQHGEFWQFPHNHMHGQKCPMCAKEESIEKNRNKNIINFIQESKNRFGTNYTFPHINNEFQNQHSKLTIKCNKCGSEFIKRAGDHLTSSNGGCKECCKLEKLSAKPSYTLDEIQQHNIKNLELIPFEGIKYLNDKIVAVCPKHGNYEIVIDSFLKGKTQCKACVVSQCSQEKKERFKETFPSRLKELTNGNAIPLMETFVDSQTYMTFRCNVCGREYKRQPNIILTEKLVQPCQHCIKEEIKKRRTKTTEQFITDAIHIHGDKYDYSKTEYIQSDQKVEISCKECGRTFFIEANSHLQGHGCPYHYNNKSTYETELVDFLKNYGIDNIITNDRTVLEGHELDIYLPSYSIAIEFDGIFWHSELYKTPHYHIDKTIQCEKKGIRLIHIFEDEWVNKKEIWQSILKYILGVSSNVIYARKCEIQTVPTNEASRFLNNNHLQGTCGSSIKYGLYYNDELVSLMTFGKSRHFIGNGKNQYELLRFCNKINTRVIGSASKLFKHFISTYQPQNIVSYADRRWSIGNLYDKLGFTLYNMSKPNYFYVIKGERKNRFNFRKSILIEKYNCPTELSEQEFCKQQKWFRIYDCGCLCYEWKS